MKVRLRSPVWLGTKCIPAGVVCEVQKYSPAIRAFTVIQGKYQFMVFCDEVICIPTYGAENVENGQ